MLCNKNGTIIGPDGREKADLYVENGRIAAVGGTLPYDESWDAEGCRSFRASSTLTRTWRWTRAAR